MQVIIAIDVGTSNCKAVTINKAGEIMHTCKAACTTISKEEGQSEQEPDIIFEKVVGLLQQSFAANEENEISAVSFSAAMHSIIAVDRNGKPLTNAITWADTRSKLYATQLLKNENYDRLYEQTGTPVHPMSPLCKLMWLKNERKEIFEKAYKFIGIKEYIFFKLFGKYIVDHSIASATGLFDIYNLTWFDAALQTAGIAAEKLSTPVEVTHAETELVDDYKNLFSLNAAVAFVVGGNDGCLANLGTGVIHNGEVALTIGTSGAIRMTNDTTKPDTKKRLFNYLLTDKIYVTGGPINNGGIVLNWVCELLTISDADVLMTLAEKAPAGADKLLFLPYLLGERAPIWNADAKGLLFGLQMLHKKEHVSRAVVEGISFALYDILVALEETNGEVNKIYVSGGFIKSKFWLQLLADMFNKKIIVSNTADASATGAACIAMLALGWIKNLAEIKQFFKNEETFYCNKHVYEVYKELFKIFRSLYDNLKNTYSELATITIG